MSSETKGSTLPRASDRVVRRGWHLAILVASSAALLTAGTPGSVIASGAQVPEPASCSTPIVITRGGTYSGCWRSTDDTPAISIATREPVVIANSTVMGPSDLIRAAVGARVRIRHVTGLGGTGRFFFARGIAEIVIRNCTISRTTGIRLDHAAESARALVSQNRVRNIQHADYNTVFFQAADVQTATIEVSWNEVINVFGRSGVEDIVSIYNSANASIHDNYLQGAYPEEAAHAFSGSGIMIEGESSHDNAVFANHIVETTNVGIGIAGGYRNKAFDNRLVFDGRLWDGTGLAAANVGFFVWNLDEDPQWAQNDAHGNVVGWKKRSGERNDWWLPNCSGNCSNRRLGGALSRDRELAEFSVWKRKLVANGVKVGRKPTVPNP